MHQSSLIRLLNTFTNKFLDAECLLRQLVLLIFYFFITQVRPKNAKHSATSLQFLLHHACPGEQVFNFVETLTPLW